jgi:hypothetical protein
MIPPSDDAWVAEDPTLCPVCFRESCEEHLLAPPTLNGHDAGAHARPAIGLVDRLPPAPTAVLAPAPHWKRLDLAALKTWSCEPLTPIIGGLVAHANFVYVGAETQTGKTLMSLYIARKLLHGGTLFDKFPITPVDRLLYLVLEDPDRRIRDRLLDTNHEFPPVESERCIFYVAPGFSLTDDAMWLWLDHLIVTERRSVVFLDTYQKATPGITSFDDEKQSVILHKLANLTRQRGVTLFVIDHVRKQQGGSKRRGDIAIDDIKGTGGKAQNADCVILLERTPDKKQIKLQAFSKDFDHPVRILLDVAPQGSATAKFTYAGDLEQLGKDSHSRKEANLAKVFEAMPLAVWVSAPELVEATGMTQKTVQRYLRYLADAGRIDEIGEKRWKQYQRTVKA